MKLNKFIVIFCLSILISSSVVWSVEKIKKSKIVAPITTNTSKIISIEPIEEIPQNLPIKEIEKSVIPKLTPIISTKPDISAESYLVGNLRTGEIYKSLNSDKVFPIASVSKLYTSLIAKHVLGLQKIININQSSLDTYGDAGHLVLDEKWTTEDLLYPLLMESSNDAAKALAESYGEESFISQMNDFALEIGMKNTKFKDSSGLSPKNVSTASDLFILSQYLYNNERDLLKISNTKEISFATTSDHGMHHFKNINPYAYYYGSIGGKTGRTTEARESMISLFKEIPEINNEPMSVIVLRSSFGEREKDTEKILGLMIVR